MSSFLQSNLVDLLEEKASLNEEKLKFVLVLFEKVNKVIIEEIGKDKVGVAESVEEIKDENLKKIF